MDANQKVVVIGGAGMLGHKIFQRLRKNRECICTLRGNREDALLKKVELLQGPDVRWNVDVSDFDGLRSLLEELNPAWIVNCVGIIKQRSAAQAAIPSIQINSLLPHYLAEWAEAWNGRLIHFSTDCVFDGRRGNYTETDTSNAEDLYGRTKYLGEVGGRANALTLRTSFIGRELCHCQGLLEWFLAQDHGRIRGFRKVIYSGVTTNFMARLVERIMNDHPSLSGLYQATAPPISKHDLLSRLRDRFGLEVEIEADDMVVSVRSMSCEKLSRTIGYVPPAWQELVDELAADPTPYDQWRSRE